MRTFLLLPLFWMSMHGAYAADIQESSSQIQTEQAVSATSTPIRLSHTMVRHPMDRFHEPGTPTNLERHNRRAITVFVIALLLSPISIALAATPLAPPVRVEDTRPSRRMGIRTARSTVIALPMAMLGYVTYQSLRGQAHVMHDRRTANVAVTFTF